MGYIGITMGDPAGVGAEIILKSMYQNISLLQNCIVFGSKEVLDYYNQHFMWGAMPLSAPGSNQQVSTDNSRDCLGKVLRYIAG